MLTTAVRTWHCYKTKVQILKKIMPNTQLFQYFGSWAKNSNITNNNAERGEYVLFKLGMLAILFCCRQTGIIRLKAKTNVAFECEFVCRIA